MSFDELIPKSTSIDNSTPAVQAWSGKIAENAEDADDRIYVIIPGADGSQHRHGPCSFDPRGEQLPEKGDDCLVVFDEDGDPWIVSWTPADGTDPPGPGGGSAELPTAEIFDYFPDAALGSLTDADSEQTYHSTATTSPFELTVQTSGGKKVLTHSAESGAGAGYAELPLDGDGRWAFARVRFQPGATPGSAVAISFPSQSIALGGYPEMAPHTAFNPAGSWEAGVWEGTPTAVYDTSGDSGALSGASTLGFAPYDGVTECLLGFTVDENGTLRMLLPNGDVVTTQDARYKTLCGPWAFIEIYVTDAATDVKPEIIDWQAGTTESEAAQWLMDRGQTAELVKKMLERYPSTALVQAYAQPLDAQLTDLAAINPATSDMIASDGTNFIGRTWAQIKASLAIAMADVSGLVAALGAKLDSSALDTDGTLAANSDAKVATQKAAKTYADTKLPLAGGTLTGALIAGGGIDLAGAAIEDSVSGLPWITGGIYTDADVYADGSVYSGDALAGNRLLIPVAFKSVPTTGSKTLLLTTADPSLIVIGTTPATGGIVKLPSLDTGDYYMLTLVNRTANPFTLSKDGVSNAIVNLAGSVGDIVIASGTWIQLGYYSGGSTFYQIGG